jgi:hypothetical protein
VVGDVKQTVYLLIITFLYRISKDPAPQHVCNKLVRQYYRIKIQHDGHPELRHTSKDTAIYIRKPPGIAEQFEGEVIWNGAYTVLEARAPEKIERGLVDCNMKDGWP